MVFARLTKKKQGLHGLTPNGWPVVATFDRGSRLRVIRASDNLIILESPVDGSLFKTTWDGIRILPKGEEP